MRLTEIRKALDLPATFKPVAQIKIGVGKVTWMLSETKGTTSAIVYSDPARVMEIKNGSFEFIAKQFLKHYDLWTDFSKLDLQQIQYDLHNFVKHN